MSNGFTIALICIIILISALVIYLKKKQIEFRKEIEELTKEIEEGKERLRLLASTNIVDKAVNDALESDDFKNIIKTSLDNKLSEDNITKVVRMAIEEIKEKKVCNMKLKNFIIYAIYGCLGILIGYGLVDIAVMIIKKRWG